MNHRGRFTASFDAGALAAPFCAFARRQGMVIRALIAVVLTIAATSCWAVEVSVTDGDTLILDGVPYRLDGIEAPQTDQTCLDDKGATWTTCVAPTEARIAFTARGALAIVQLWAKPSASINGWCSKAGHSISIGLPRVASKPTETMPAPIVWDSGRAALYHLRRCGGSPSAPRFCWVLLAPRGITGPSAKSCFRMSP